MYLIVGLGNPGEQYAHTRHNTGFDILETLAKKLGVSVTRKKDEALVGECFYHGQKLVLALPQTYMNLSGRAVAALMRWYKLPPENLMVLYDDIDLPQGTVRIRPNGSAGTHNGMRSIVGELGGREDFPRVRVGVGQREPGYELADWVLSRYHSPEEKEAAQKAFEQAALAVLETVDHGIESAMCKYNTRKPKKPKPAPGATPEAIGGESIGATPEATGGEFIGATPEAIGRESMGITPEATGGEPMGATPEAIGGESIGATPEEPIMEKPEGDGE